MKNRRHENLEPGGKHPSALWYILGGAAIGAGVSALPLGLAWTFLHPPRRFHKQTPLSFLNAPFEHVRLVTDDGVRLSGWFVPAAVPHSTAPKGLVILCHGYHGNRGKMLPYLAFLHRAGYHALLFDFRAHGWSGGREATLGIREPLDLCAALDWAGTRPDLSGVPVALLGESMGASVALLVAAQDERVRAVVADSPYARLDKAVEGQIRLAFGPQVGPVVVPQTRRVGEKLLGVSSASVAPVDVVHRIAPRPVFLIHGLDDMLITPDNAHQIQAASPETVQLWEVEGARHVRSVYVAPDEYARRVLAFLGKTLEPTSPKEGE